MSSKLVDTLTTLKHVQKQFRDSPKDYDVGFYNGMELVISMMEARPSFYVTKGGSYKEEDVDKYPEHFL